MRGKIMIAMYKLWLHRLHELDVQRKAVKLKSLDSFINPIWSGSLLSTLSGLIWTANKQYDKDKHKQR